MGIYCLPELFFQRIGSSYYRPSLLGCYRLPFCVCSAVCIGPYSRLSSFLTLLVYSTSDFSTSVSYLEAGFLRVLGLRLLFWFLSGGCFVQLFLSS